MNALFLIAGVSLLGAISPGPDFVIVVRNSLVYSRKIGFLTAFGVSLALIVHLSYTLIGIGVLIAESSLAYTLIKYIGAAYLFYLGFSGIISSYRITKSASLNLNYTKSANEIDYFTALKQGFFTNLLNPKAAIFFISLFSQFISVDTPLFLRAQFAFINLTITLAWFLFLSFLITGKYFTSRIDSFRSYIDRVMGAALILLSLKLILV